MKRHAKVLFAVTALFLLFCSSQAYASKNAVATLGSTTTGTVGGGFNAPRGVAVNQTGGGGVAQGTFYVVDSNNNRIQRFSPSGGFVGAWGWGVATNANAYEVCTQAGNCKKGKAGTGAGEFGSNGAQGVAIDQTNGVVYVSDQVNRRIDVFTATGSFLGAFGWGAISGASSLQFCTALTSCGAPAATAPATGNVGGGQFGAAIGGLAVDSSHKLYVADKTSRRIDVFVPTIPIGGIVTGVEFLRAFGWGTLDGGEEFQVCTVATCHAPAAAGTGLGQFGANSPSDVTVDPSGNIFALDTANKRVQKLDSTPAPVAAAFGQAALSATFGTGELLGLATDASTDHVFVAAKRSTAANKVAVAELDGAGASVETHGAALTATAANGLAVSPATAGGAIFLTTTTGGQFVYVLNDVTTPTIDPVSVHGATTATFSGTVVSYEALVFYHFEYSTDGLTWTSFPAQDVEVGPEAGTIAVSQEVEGLSGSQPYHVRLRASRQTPGGTVTSTETTLTTDPAAPAVSQEGVSSRLDTSATLEGKVNPQNQASTYHFEYTDQADFEANGYANATKVPALEASAGAGNAPVAVSQDLSGLQPDTTYHFHLLATNATNTAEGPDATFRTFGDLSPSEDCANQAIRAAQHTTFLGECRGIELVNNPDKGNQNVRTNIPEIATPMMSSDGDEVLWSVLGGAPGSSTGTGASFLASRTAGGWQSKNLVPPAAEQVGEGTFKYQLEATTPDFSKFLFLAGGSSFANILTPSLVTVDRSGNQEVLNSYPTSVIGVGNAGTGVDLTDDAQHVFFVNPETAQLEDIGSGTPELISVMPDGQPSECGLLEEHSSFSFVGPSGARFGASNSWHPGYHRFSSTDGSVVYFEARPNGHCFGSYGLYVRDRATETTTLIDQGGPNESGEDAYAIRATPDGQSIYFVSVNQLDPNDANADPDIYRWDAGSGASTCLTCIVPDANLLNNGSIAAVLVSDDFSHIYFQSTSELVPGKGTLGHANIYVLNDGVLRFVADTVQDQNLFSLATFQSGVNALLSPDGNTLVFKATSIPELTPDVAAAECVNSEGRLIEGCEQLYRYDDESDELDCVSCLKGGVTTGNVSSSSSANFSAFNVSADGSTVAFVTAAALLPRDINNSSDVYEWRNGAVHLLSDGVSQFAKSVLAAPAVRGVDADGSDIFFSLVDPGRTGFERDGQANLYDARIGGGFMPPPPPQHCSEESCQGPLQAAPAVERAGSSSLGGAGNEKGSAKRPARCSKKHGKAKHRCQRAHKKGKGRPTSTKGAK